MDIRLVEGRHKSITSLDWKNIPHLAVITGANGAGKTQLLELIAASAGVRTPEPGDNRRHDENTTIKVKVDGTETLNRGNTVFLRSYWNINDPSASIEQIFEQAKDAWNERNSKGIPSNSDDSWGDLWLQLESKCHKDRTEFTEEEFLLHLPPNFPLIKKNAMHPPAMHNLIPLLFVGYAAKLFDLQRSGCGEESAREKLAPLPWDTVNHALQIAGLSYKVQQPEIPASSWAKKFNISYRLELESTVSGSAIPVSSLSSGERVIFMTAIWSYFFNQEMLGSETALLLLDEPDAHLHPALTKKFLRVIREELIGRRGIRVIMTTHSPSSVALAGEENLFVMAQEEPRIRPVVNKWDAVACLTSGLVTVGTETKVVFVEDERDVSFYNRLQSFLAFDSINALGFDDARLLKFIPSSIGRQGGGKQMVIRWVNDIESSQVAGIVDRDDDGAPVGRVYVGGRRHLESYLLDPLFIFALLLEDNSPSIPELIDGIDFRYSRKLLELDSEKLQMITDRMSSIYQDLSPETSRKTVAIEYIGGAIVFVPEWIINCDAKKNLFDQVRKRFNATWSLDYLIRKYEVIGIVPKEIASVLVKIQGS